jgi:hypothetical protein
MLYNHALYDGCVTTVERTDASHGQTKERVLKYTVYVLSTYLRNFSIIAFVYSTVIDKSLQIE